MVRHRCATRNFNSRPRVGGVGYLSRGKGFAGVFQFSPPRGGRPRRVGKRFQHRYFNSRPRVGGVRMERENNCAGGYFNSRPRVGGVETLVENVQNAVISILAPAWGASSVPKRYQMFNHVYFNSRPRVGGVQISIRVKTKIIIFQFSPPRGGRLSQQGLKII